MLQDGSPLILIKFADEPVTNISLFPYYIAEALQKWIELNTVNEQIKWNVMQLYSKIKFHQMTITKLIKRKRI